MVDIISLGVEMLHFLFPMQCYNEMLLKYNFFHRECVSMVMSRLLGLGLTLGSLMLFVPQIVKIQLARSSEGILLSSQMLGLTACFATSAYSYVSNFVFSQWGDSLFVAIQTVIIIAQILWFTSRRAHAAMFIVFCWMVTCAVIYDYVPLPVLATLQALTIPIIITAKLMQIRTNYQQRNTGQLSLLSVILQTGGCLTRIFTSVKETGDLMIIISYVVATVLNGTILAQILLYWSGSDKKKVI